MVEAARVEICCHCGLVVEGLGEPLKRGRRGRRWLAILRQYCKNSYYNVELQVLIDRSRSGF